MAVNREIWKPAVFEDGWDPAIVTVTCHRWVKSNGVQLAKMMTLLQFFTFISKPFWQV